MSSKLLCNDKTYLKIVNKTKVKQNLNGENNCIYILLLDAITILLQCIKSINLQIILVLNVRPSFHREVQHPQSRRQQHIKDKYKELTQISYSRSLMLTILKGKGQNRDVHQIYPFCGDYFKSRNFGNIDKFEI